MQLFQILPLVLLIGFGVCQTSNNLDSADIEKQLKNNFPALENFNSSKLPTEEDVEKLVREKCDKNGGGEEAFNALKEQQTELQACIEAQLNATEIQAELEESKKTGSMDEVFGKYCQKYPEIYKCITTVTEKVKPCLDPQEQDTMNKTLNVVDEIKEFVCYKDGDRIAMFIAEGGVECLESRKEQLQECANKTLGSRIPTDMSVNSLPMFLFTERECDDFDEVRKCFNTELEKCKDSTPANIVDAFFKFLKKHLPCGTTGQRVMSVKADEPSSSSVVTLSLLVVGFMVLLSRFL
ncbi:27 kDa hemolymph protein-like [Zophobas morio]|uniref:27 kDa hemolymph protein-like n=1 Tax=Zophobas morio TaxID=2755281 RepID=UPI003082A26E